MTPTKPSPVLWKMRILTRWTRLLQGPAQPSRHLPEVLVSTIELLINITRRLLYIVIFLCNQAEWKVEVMILLMWKEVVLYETLIPVVHDWARKYKWESKKL